MPADFAMCTKALRCPISHTCYRGEAHDKHHPRQVYVEPDRVGDECDIREPKEAHDG